MVDRHIGIALPRNQGRTQDSVQGGASFNFRAKREKFFEFAPP